MEDGLCAKYKGHTDTITQIEFNYTTNQIISSSDDYSVMVWPFNKETEPKRKHKA